MEKHFPVETQVDFYNEVDVGNLSYSLALNTKCVSQPGLWSLSAFFFFLTDISLKYCRE